MATSTEYEVLYIMLTATPAHILYGVYLPLVALAIAVSFMINFSAGRY